MGVTTQLRHEHVGRERPHRRHHRHQEGFHPGRVPGPRSQRHVDRRTRRRRTAGLAGSACPREESHLWRELVDRDRQHAGVLVEDRLRSVAVMHIDIHVRHPLHSLVQHPRDRDRRIVVDAESGRACGHRVMQSTGGVERMRDLTGEHRSGRFDRRSRHDRSRLVHVIEDGVVARPVPETGPRPIVASARSLRRVEVFGCVDQQERGEFRRLRGQRVDVGVAVQPVGMDQIPGEQDPLRS